MSWREIRPVALGILRRRADGTPRETTAENRPKAAGDALPGDDELLLSVGYDPETDEKFYRPVGGGVDFGEYSDIALAREFHEEMEVTVTEVRHLATLEDIFEFDGDPGHEIWFLYEALIEESWPYELDAFDAYEEEIDEPFRVEWVAVDDVERRENVHPAHLLDLL